ncbi:hypothetical protein OIU85_013639 [Salix viminalis]|uniref:Uncharacterized protein n=1 Tax=Salix viminalis TaxID=40686 RepID=A0A9Q0NM89_SALVM|nr:hypothetical protein OIU85_013639 [Salix viminalis]
MQERLQLEATGLFPDALDLPQTSTDRASNSPQTKIPIKAWPEQIVCPSMLKQRELQLLWKMIVLVQTPFRRSHTFMREEQLIQQRTQHHLHFEPSKALCTTCLELIRKYQVNELGLGLRF